MINHGAAFVFAVLTAYIGYHAANTSNNDIWLMFTNNFIANAYNFLVLFCVMLAGSKLTNQVLLFLG